MLEEREARNGRARLPSMVKGATDCKPLPKNEALCP